MSGEYSWKRLVGRGVLVIVWECIAWVLYRRDYGVEEEFSWRPREGEVYVSSIGKI